uniref:Secreted protein n=1 Tax=Oryza brachyantha TaxID=4533 RepID=J3MC88_ORYBR
MGLPMAFTLLMSVTVVAWLAAMDCTTQGSGTTSVTPGSSGASGSSAESALAVRIWSAEASPPKTTSATEASVSAGGAE